MNDYSSIASLSIVHHQRLFVPRLNPETEAARVNLLNALVEETEARNKAGLWMMSPRDPRYAAAYEAQRPAIERACIASKRFHTAADKDNRLVPTFWVKE